MTGVMSLISTSGSVPILVIVSTASRLPTSSTIAAISIPSARSQPSPPVVSTAEKPNPPTSNTAPPPPPPSPSSQSPPPSPQTAPASPTTNHHPQHCLLALKRSNSPRASQIIRLSATVAAKRIPFATSTTGSRKASWRCYRGIIGTYVYPILRMCCGTGRRGCVEGLDTRCIGVCVLISKLLRRWRMGPQWALVDGQGGRLGGELWRTFRSNVCMIGIALVRSIGTLNQIAIRRKPRLLPPASYSVHRSINAQSHHERAQLRVLSDLYIMNLDLLTCFGLPEPKPETAIVEMNTVPPLVTSIYHLQAISPP